MANAICGPGFSKKIGEPDMDGFKATIMDLIDRKYLKMEKEPDWKKNKWIKKDMVCRFNVSRYNSRKDSSELKSYEKSVINFLGSWMRMVNILDAMSDNLSVPESAKSLRESYDSWREGNQTSS